jgi:hypothetical protein
MHIVEILEYPRLENFPPRRDMRVQNGLLRQLKADVIPKAVSK